MEELAQARRALWRILALKLVAATAKLGIGFWTGSLSLVADGLNSVFDGVSSLIALLGVRIAAQPADQDHPYGHRKAETIATLAIAVFLFLTTWELLSGAIGRLIDPASPTIQVNVWSFAAMLLSLAINLGILATALPLGRRLHSAALIATGLDTRADVMIAISVLLGLTGMRLGYPILDPLLAILIAGIIAKTGIDILRENAAPLMDRAVLPADEVLRIALSVPGVIACHQVRSRGQENAAYADLHIQVDPGMSTQEAHSIAHEVQYRLRQHATGIEDVTIHVEPTGTPENHIGPDAAETIRQLANELELGIHDMWAYALDQKLYVEIHVEAAPDLALARAHELATTLEERANAAIPDLGLLTTHLEPSGPQPTLAIMPPKRMEAQVKAIVDHYLGGDTCHHVQLRARGDAWDLSFHCRLPGDLSLAQAHEINTRLEWRLRAELGHLSRVIIHTEPQEHRNGDPHAE